MATHQEIDRYLRERDLEAEGGKEPHVMRIAESRHPWIRKYAWLGPGWIPARPVATPSPSDRLFLVVENLSVWDCVVEFECRAMRGKVVFENSAPSGTSVRSVPAPPSVDGHPIPCEEQIHIGITEEELKTEIIAVDAVTTNVDAASSKMPVERGRLTLRFP